QMCIRDRKWRPRRRELELALTPLGDGLFGPSGRVLSSAQTDLAHQFVHWRKFGFEELRTGNLALWNPYIYGGAPFFGGFQSALLYPPNVLFLVLPLAAAVNWSIALHVFLTGAFMFAWAAHRGLHAWACVMCGALVMFGGTLFPHVYAGHLPNLCTMAWAPLVFLAVDKLAERPGFGGGLLGAFAVAMQILAGHPQYVFYTGIAALVYAGLNLRTATDRLKFVTAVLGLYGGGAALGAVQLLTGLAESGETLRGAGLSYEFAAMFSFPPENLLTLVAPELFGNVREVPYWGRCHFWEMSLFFGASALALAVLGAARGGAKRRHAVTMVVVLLVLALGANTPLFKFLYEWVPGFDRFRGTSKFAFPASLFLVLLAGLGVNELLSRGSALGGVPPPGGRALRATAVGTFGLAVALGIAAVWVHLAVGTNPTGSGWGRVMAAVRDTGELFLPSGLYSDPDFVRRAGRHAAASLGVASGTLALAGLLLLWSERQGRFALALAAVALVESAVFARRTVTWFELSAATPEAVKRFLAERPGDYRIANPAHPHSAMSLRVPELLGNDPGVLRRYAELVAFTQGQNPDEVLQHIPLTREHPLLGMLRLRFLFLAQGGERYRVAEFTNDLPRVLLVGAYKVLPNRDAIFNAMANPAFDPRREVILETEPEPRPAPGEPDGEVRVVESSTDHLTVEARLRSPAILLITDAYSRHWRVRALTGSGQQAYRVMPANYCLRAIALAAGEHRLRLEYAPWGFAVGRWISLGAAAVGLAFLFGRAVLGRSRGRRWRMIICNCAKDRAETQEQARRDA
ncbi:MAG: hypothetical protein N3I86_14145, partial [Verrucomicrobiae bacterium]|nr:hypothetical protein [Verrucomicrobiae bacterium]